MVQRVSRPQVIRRLMPTMAIADDCDDSFWMAEDKVDLNSYSNDELARMLNEEDGFAEDDADRYVVYGDDDYVEPGADDDVEPEVDEFE